MRTRRSTQHGKGDREEETGGGEVDRRRETYVKANQVVWVCEKESSRGVCLVSGSLTLLSILVAAETEGSRDTAESLITGGKARERVRDCAEGQQRAERKE